VHPPQTQRGQHHPETDHAEIEPCSGPVSEKHASLISQKERNLQNGNNKYKCRQHNSRYHPTLTECQKPFATPADIRPYCD
jgi:hypothetical protein